jgi:hypothetical protein
VLITGKHRFTSSDTRITPHGDTRKGHREAREHAHKSGKVTADALHILRLIRSVKGV